eukprot:2461146-Pyramimonas_sp.AAC.1
MFCTCMCPPSDLRVMLAGPKGRESGRKWGTKRGDEKRGRETRGVACILAVIGTGGPVKRSNVIITCPPSGVSSASLTLLAQEDP